MLHSWNQPRVRRPRRRFAGLWDDWLARFGSVTHMIMWVTAIAFLVKLVFDALRVTMFDTLFALSAHELARGFIWQPVSYMFLHGSIWHILINLLILWFFGREVEFFIGPKFYTRLYFLAGIAGAALWLAFNFNAPPTMVNGVPIYPSVIGASAAVLGCVIAFATLFPNREITLLVFFILPVTIKAKYLAIAAVALDVVPLIQGAPTNVAHLAHLGGAAFGYIYIKHLGYGVTPRWMHWMQALGRALSPRRRPKPRVMTREEFIREQVDPILDKIAREGMQSLTRRERKILESARDLMADRQR